MPPWHRHHAHHARHHHHHRGFSLRRQLFFAFTGAIVLTALTTGAVAGILGSPGWKQGAGDAVRVRDAAGTIVGESGDVAACRAWRPSSVGDRVVEVCTRSEQPHRPWRKLLLVLVPVAVLWAVAGRVARRMGRPLAELTAVARDLGQGRLERRSELRWASGEVGALSAAMNDMAERLETKIKSERELLATVSHELRTPLARVRLLCELGRGGSSRDVLGEIEGEAVAMDALVGDLLAGARIDFDALQRRPVDVAALAREAAARHAQRREVVAPAVETGEAPREPVAVDATLLARALDTMLDNAHQHAGGATAVRVAARDGRLVVEVDDAGPGFSADDLAHAFEPFYRGRGAAPDEKRGVGLGLHIVRRVAEAHRGQAYAENLERGGARVGLSLPIGNGAG
jgi:signal transduction histidine kinase